MEQGNTTSKDESLHTKTGDVSNNDKQATTDEYKAKHDALYGKYTAKAEKEFELSKKLFKSNPDEIEAFSDSVKNKIVKEEYGYDTFEEAKTVLGETFYKTTDDTNEDDDDLEHRLARLEKERKVADYKAKKTLLDNKIENYILKNPSLGEDSYSLIKTELEKISESIDIEERISTAVALVKMKHGSNEDVSFATTTAGRGKALKTSSDETVERNPELGKLFGNKI